MRSVRNRSDALLERLEPDLQGVVARILDLEQELGGRPRVLFTGCRAGDGTTVIAAACAAALARTQGRHAILVETNLGAPGLADLLELPRSPGLADVLAGELPAARALVQLEPLRLSALVAGQAGPRPELEPERTRAILEAAVRATAAGDPPPRAIVTLVDAPPILARPAVRGLLESCHGSVLVVRAGFTHLSHARAAARSLRNSGVPVLGAVLNRFAPSIAFPERQAVG